MKNKFMNRDILAFIIGIIIGFLILIIISSILIFIYGEFYNTEYLSNIVMELFVISTGINAYLYCNIKSKTKDGTKKMKIKKQITYICAMIVLITQFILLKNIYLGGLTILYGALLSYWAIQVGTKK